MEKSDVTSEIIKDIKHVASKLRQRELSRSEYLQHGRFSEYNIYDGGHTWGELCDAAGILTKRVERVPDEVYFARLKKAVQVLGRYPKNSERKLYGLNFSKVRYATLGAFIRKAISMGVIEPFAAAAISETPAVEEHLLAASTMETGPKTSRTRKIQRRQEAPPIPKETKRVKWERIDIDGFPYAPQEEESVVALFAILCSKGYINWQILDLSGGRGIDAICYDNDSDREIRVELKYVLSRASWNHSIEDIDHVVCWQNRWPEFPKPVLELSNFVRTLNSR